MRSCRKAFDYAEAQQQYDLKTFYKTASLPANAARSVAVLGGCEPAVCDLAQDYGRHLGMAFQVPSPPCPLPQAAGLQTSLPASLPCPALSNLQHLSLLHFALGTFRRPLVLPPLPRSSILYNPPKASCQLLLPVRSCKTTFLPLLPLPFSFPPVTLPNHCPSPSACPLALLCLATQQANSLLLSFSCYLFLPLSSWHICLLNARTSCCCSSSVLARLAHPCFLGFLAGPLPISPLRASTHWSPRPLPPNR